MTDTLNRTGNELPSALVGVTSSRVTRTLGVATLFGLVATLALALFWSTTDTRFNEETGLEEGQQDAVRLLYVHVPMALLAYLAVSVGVFASAMFLWKRGRWWDTVAHASIEIGTVFCGLMLVTGSIWGKPIWNTWWEWGDVRLMTSLILFLLCLGYLSFRRVPGDQHLIAKRSAVIALLCAPLMVIVNRSVEWWENNTLHQQSTLAEFKLEDSKMFTFFFAIVVFTMLYSWLMMHRFRLAWMEAELDEFGLEDAIRERQAEYEA